MVVRCLPSLLAQMRAPFALSRTLTPT
jgi:hypothetical protein